MLNIRQQSTAPAASSNAPAATTASTPTTAPQSSQQTSPTSIATSPSSSPTSTPVSTQPSTTVTPSTTTTPQTSSTATPSTVISTTSSTPSSISTQSTSSTPTSTSSTSTSTTPASSTFSSTVYIQTTNSLGQTTSFAPLRVTSTFLSTMSDGGVQTFTEVIANPTLRANDNSASTSQFFHNTGAVAGVFLIVGLAAATICLWIFFFIRRRRRRRRIDHASEVSATLTAAGYNRAPIDDEDLGPGPGMRQRFGSFSSHPTISTPITDEERAGDATGPNANLYDPYVGYGRVAGSGYVPARSESPSLYSRDRRAEGSYTSGGSRPGGSHVPQHSMGSADQLLSGGIPAQAIPEPFPLTSPMVPPRNPKRQEVQSQDSSSVSGSQNPFDLPPPDYRGRGVAGGSDQKR